MTKLIVRVRDVNGREYAPPTFTATYSVQPAPGMVTAPGIARAPLGAPWEVPATVDTLSLGVGTQAPGFSGENFTIKKTSAGWRSDNPAATISVQGDTVSIDVVDGTVRLAPTVYIPPDKMVHDNPKAALVEPGQNWIYYGAYLNPVDIRVIPEPIVFKNDTPDIYPYDVKKVVMGEKGSWVFLEFGFDPTITSRKPRFLIGVWAPRKKLEPTPQVIVFYKPPNKLEHFPADYYPFLGAYPYSPFMTSPPRAGIAAKSLVQMYPSVAINYMLSGYKIIPQIQAAGRNPIVIMPMPPTGGWGPLGLSAGIARLTKEVVRFLYAKQIVSSKADPTARLSLDAGRASIFPSAGLYTSESVPKTYSLTVAGFSNGIDHVLDVCAPPLVDKAFDPYDPTVFATTDTTFTDSWREIWDIDGVADNGAGSTRHHDTLRDWIKSDRRRLRLYHSDTGIRTAPRSLVEATRITMRPAKPYKGIYIEEGTSADGKTTWVYFSDTTLKPPSVVDGDDAHHTMTALMFGHAAQFPLP
jgi:hypothetical protein